MKKVKLILVMLIASLSGFSQLATLNQQTITIVRIDTTNARLQAIRNTASGQATSANQTIANNTLTTISSTLTNITNSLTTIASTIGVNTASIAVVKTKLDTTNQELRAVNVALAVVSETVGVNTASLAVIKTKQDTIAQNTRSINTAVTGTLSSFSLNKTYMVGDTLTTSASAYASGDNIGGIITLTNVARYDGGSAFLTGFSIWDNENQKPNLVIDFYNASPSGTYTDNEPQVMAGDAGVWIGSISVLSSQFVTQGAIARYTVNFNILSTLFYGTAAPGKDYYMTISTTSTPTWSSPNGLVFKASFKQD